jgi:hypothetical protein
VNAVFVKYFILQSRSTRKRNETNVVGVPSRIDGRGKPRPYGYGEWATCTNGAGGVDRGVGGVDDGWAA